MDLASYFLEAEVGVEVCADVVLVQRFDAGVGQAFGGEIGKGFFEQASADAALLEFGQDREVGDAADAGGLVDACGDVADDLPVDFGDEDALMAVLLRGAGGRVCPAAGRCRAAWVRWRVRSRRRTRRPGWGGAAQCRWG